MNRAAMTPSLRRYDYVIQRLLPTLLLDGFKSVRDRKPEPGDLVWLQSAPQSDWHLSFYREAGAGTSFSQEHLVESVRTGELCKWQNVGFLVLDPERTRLGARAAWPDAYFNFSDKFDRVCQRGDFYIERPYIDRIEGEQAFIAFRTRWGLDEKRTAIEPVRLKIGQKRLLDALKAGAAAHKASRT